jgi:TorA maturation chaperone TorD
VSETGGHPAGEPLEPEDAARANLYGLVSRLFYGPVDPNLLAEIGGSGRTSDEGGALVEAWGALQEACRGAFPAVVRQEYDSLFIGVGKAAVTPYLSGYAEPVSPDRFLVRLRGQLAAWELARREMVFEVEDHISGVSDVMRWLIQHRHPLAEQRAFFESFVYPGAVDFLAAVEGAPAAGFYKAVSGLAAAFLEVERSAFEIESDG